MEAKALKNKRRVIKTQVTKFKSYLERWNVDCNTEELISRLNKFESLHEEFKNVQHEIDIITEEEDDEFSVFDDDYFELIGKAKKHINAQQITQTRGESDQTGSNYGTHNFNSAIKLPSIELPTFSGEYDQWVVFCDTFTALIDASSSLNNVQKFHYLRSSLKGEALEVIHSLESSTENYQIAWSLLQKRYQNKQLIVHQHIKSLFNLPNIQKDKSTELRHLVDNLQKHMRALKALDRPTDMWDDLIIHLVTTKFDYNTQREWEDLLSKHDELPTMVELTDFLYRKCQLLEKFQRTVKTINSASQSTTQPSKNNKFNNTKKNFQTACITTEKGSCPVCKGAHPIYSCEQFLDCDINGRYDEVKRLKLCFNYLRPNHASNNCKSGACKKCNKSHNTLLHSEETSTATVANYATAVGQILLSTALVEIKNINTTKTCRVLLDSGSQSNFITQESCNQLGLKPQPIQISVSGIGNTMKQINKMVEITIKSKVNSFQKQLSCLIVPRITENLPQISIDVNEIQVPKNVQLADPDFYKSGPIDLLLGAELFFDLMCIGQIQTGRHSPVLQKTQLGWVVSGKVGDKGHTTSCQMITNCELNEQLKKFWEIEEIPNSNHMSNEEKECEKHFQSTVTQDNNGRFVVRLPFKLDPRSLGKSRSNAERRFYNLERRLLNSSQLRTDYTEFMTEYIKLNHMEEVAVENEATFYLPHHGVKKEGSTTTRLRVVFDGSASSSNGISLNDILMVGPKTQPDLFDIILRFRKHNIVMSADIAKMYRQIRVDPVDADIQRILWREQPENELKEFRLNTVTYGTASAPFLATRCLNELAKKQATNLAEAARVVLNDFYVDDLLTGTDTIEEARTLRDNLITLLSRGCFVLGKWSSNETILQNEVPNLPHNTKSIQFGNDKERKTLGLLWSPTTDTLGYSSLEVNTKQKVTKGTVLSTISKVFDPLGLIGPTTIRAKILLQHLWELGLNWDESLPSSLHTKWNEIRHQIETIHALSIPRRVMINQNNVQIHGFCDASERAYGACVYVRSMDDIQQPITRLLCAKSKVAPLKSISLPRLELCGALLLAQLMNKVFKAMNMTIHSLYFWTDSTIVLAWIAGSPSDWKSYIANRVAEIQQFTNAENWRHVNTTENPADIISRGLCPNELENCSLWWEGPYWLKDSSIKSSTCPNINITDPKVLERKPKTITTLTTHQTKTLMEKYSSLIKLQRVIAYCLRFKENARMSKENRHLQHLTPSELATSLRCILKICQREAFCEEIKNLKSSQMVHSTSKLLTLNPFLDTNEVIRVGGRLTHASVNADQKHPIVLPKNHIITKLLIKHEHVKNLHIGPQGLLAAIRQKYWPLSGRSAVRAVTSNCIICIKAKPMTTTPLMGNLPHPRVQPTRPFDHCGVDYCGPIIIREGKRRGKIPTHKSYIAVFVCFATKAVHLELVSDMTTDAFLNTLKRFTARRGKCSHIYSDNGKNFVGANAQLKDWYQFLIKEKTHETISTQLAMDNIAWHFIPARAPNFGGLWEAAVKSVKTHLKKIIGNMIPTFEELYTLLTQIESILNSNLKRSQRPYCINTRSLPHRRCVDIYSGTIIGKCAYKSIITMATFTTHESTLLEKVVS